MSNKFENFDVQATISEQEGRLKTLKEGKPIPSKAEIQARKEALISARAREALERAEARATALRELRNRGDRQSRETEQLLKRTEEKPGDRRAA